MLVRSANNPSALARQPRQNTVRPQHITIIEVFVPQGQAVDPLRNQCWNAVLNAFLIAVIGAARREPVEQSSALVQLPSQ